VNESEPSDSILKDPVCGMKVGVDSPFRTRYDSREYVFCSRHCQEEFEATPKKYLTPALLLDLVCGMSVQPDSPFRMIYQGQEYVFCSQHCEAEFREDPERFIAAPAEYFKCPMHPGVRQAEPGTCPQCGMLLEGVRPKWVCPYHPAVLHDDPGVCPVYGMALIPEPPGRFYSCALHPEVEQLEPGRCPKCDMELQPRWAPVALVRTEWSCPMHPEVVQATPGPCPKCGMKLEPREVSVRKIKGPEGEEAPSREVSCPKCGKLVG
jgi:Cu+-exporting ATPase